MHPKFCVVIPNFNHAHYISQTILSVLNQSWKPYKVTIVDDCSTDNSVEVISELAKQHPEIQLVRHDKNLGAWDTCVHATNEVDTEYFYTIAADDFVLPGIFEKSLSLLLQHPQAAFCFSHGSQINVDRNNEFSENALRISDCTCYFSPQELAVKLNSSYVSGHTAVYRTAAFRSVGGYRKETEWHSDWWLLLVLSFRFGACFIPEALAVQRASSGSYSSVKRKNTDHQRKVLSDIINLLLSEEFRDVAPLFSSSGVLNVFGEELPETILANQELQRPEVFALTYRSLLNSLNHSKLLRDSKIADFNYVNLRLELQTSLNAATQLHSSGEIGPAVEKLKSVNSKFPLESEPYLAIASIIERLKKSDTALTIIESALFSMPGNADLLAAKGFILLRQRRMEDAKENFQAALESSSRHLDALTGLASIMEIENEIIPALELALTACDAAPPKPELLRTIDRLLSKLGNKSTSDDIVSSIVEAYPSIAEQIFGKNNNC